jgi:hypothetical protein
MRKILTRRPSPAMVIAIIALVVALAGTAVAGGGFLTKKKFKNQAVRGPLVYVTTSTSSPVLTGPSSGTPVIPATCPPGTHVVGGGIKVGDERNSFVNDSHPTPTGWAGTVFTFTSGPDTAITTAICATVKSTSGTPPA